MTRRMPLTRRMPTASTDRCSTCIRTCEPNRISCLGSSRVESYRLLEPVRQPFLEGERMERPDFGSAQGAKRALGLSAGPPVSHGGKGILREIRRPGAACGGLQLRNPADARTDLLQYPFHGQKTQQSLINPSSRPRFTSVSRSKCW